MFANKVYTKIALGIILLTVLTLSLPTGLTQAQQPVDRDNAPSCEDCDDHISPSTHSPQAYPFEVYNDISYSGTRCYSTQPETANIHSTCDDKISSVKLQSGWSARVYRDRNQGGPNACLNSSDAGLQNNTFTNGDAMDNAISSFILYDEPWCASSPTPAYPLEVYTDYSYTGTQCYSSIAETENIHSTCNDKIKSILLRTGWSIRLYRDANQSGPSVCFNRSDAGLGNNTYTNGAAMLNTISSFVLYDEPWCGGPPTPAYPLEVYNDANYSGTQCYSSRAETANIHSTCNDKVTSILLRSGWSIKVYRDTNQSGPSRCLNNNDSNLSGNTYDNGASLNNSISSFILYDEADCGGNISLYSISGKVVDSGGSALSGVTVSDGAGHTDTTDSNGNYTLTGLNAGDYTITPSKSGYTFSPSSRSVSVPPNATGKNFTGSQPTPEPDTIKPDGNITSPSNLTVIGPGATTITAEAQDNAGGSGIDRVAFWIRYNRTWHWIGKDSTSPYVIQWNSPDGLKSQIVRFAIRVYDKAGNEAIAPGGDRFVFFIASHENSSVDEGWIAKEKRAYLNQRSLRDGDVKCSTASMAMVLAMNDIIPSDYNSLSSKANEMYPSVLVNGTAYVYKMRNELRNQGANSEFHSVSVEDGWQLIKQEVNAGHPVIVRTLHGALTSYGHFVVAVGYREENNTHEVITYDSYGRWLGFCCQDNYDRNSTEQNSSKGRWVYYDFDTIFGDSNYLITASNPQFVTTMGIAGSTDTPPDEMSDEPEDIVTFEGIETGGEVRLFMPLIVKE